MPLVALATSTGRQDRIADAAVEARVELGVGDLLALEVLGQDVVVGLGGGLEELVAARRRPRPRARPGSGSRPPACRPSGRPCGGRGRRSPLNVSALPMASWSGAIFVPKASRSASRTAAGSAFSRSHLLITKRAAVRLRAAERHRVLRARPRRRPVASTQMSAASTAWKPDDDLGRRSPGSPGVSTSVTRLPSSSSEATASESDMCRFCSSGSKSEAGRPVLDPAQAVDRPGPEEECLGQRRLAGTGVAGQDDAAEVGGVDALRGHRLDWTS